MNGILESEVIQIIKNVCPWMECSNNQNRTLSKSEHQVFFTLIIMKGLSDQIVRVNEILFKYVSDNNYLDLDKKVFGTFNKLERPPARLISRNLAGIRVVSQLDEVLRLNLKDSRNLEEQDLCAAILYSAIRYGLLLRKELIDGLLSQLSSTPYMWRKIVWYEIPLVGEKHTQIWVPDSTTLALMGLWYDKGFHRSFKRPEGKSYYDIVKNFFINSGVVWKQTGFVREGLFLRSISKLLMLSLPGYVIDCVTGVIDNRTLAPNSFYRLISGLAPRLATSQGYEARARYKRSVYPLYSFSKIGEMDLKIYEKVNACLNCYSQGQEKKASKKIKDIILVSQMSLTPTMIFLGFWCANRLEGRNKWGSTSSINTMKIKFPKISKYLMSSFGSIDPCVVEEDELIDLYEEVIGEGGKGNQFPETISDYHDFLVNFCGVDAIDSGVPWGGSSEKYQNVDANVITYTEFNAVIAYYRRQIKLSPQNTDKRRLMKVRLVVFVLGFTTGLRRKEIMFLQLKDFSLLGLKEITVRPVWNRALKSMSAIRRILIGLLVPKEFMIDIDELVSFRKNTGACSTDCIFLLSPSGTINEVTVFGHIQWLMQVVTGNPRARYHHCRHSFASWTLWRWASLHLYVSDVWSSILPKYNRTDVEKEYSAVFNQADTRYPSGSLLYEMARALGHSSPSMGLEHYLHTPSLIALMYKEEMAPVFNSKIISNVAGVTVRQIEKLTRNHPYNMKVCNAITIRRLSKVAIEPDLKGWVDPEKKKIAGYKREANHELLEEFSTWSALIEREDKKSSIDVLSARYQLDKRWFKKCTEKYDVIKNMVFSGGGHNTHRHVSKNFFGGDRKIIMSFPREKCHLKTAELIIAKYHKLPSRIRKRVDTSIDYFIENGQVHRPKLRFNASTDFAKFLKMLQYLGLIANDPNISNKGFCRVTLVSPYQKGSVERCHQWIYWEKVFDVYKNQIRDVVKGSKKNINGYVELVYISSPKGIVVDSVPWLPDKGFNFSLYVLSVTRHEKGGWLANLIS